MPQRIILLIAVIATLSALLVWHSATPNQVDSAALQVAWQEDQSWSVPGLSLRWDSVVEQLTVHDTQSEAWASSPGQAWLGAGQWVDDAPGHVPDARNPFRKMQFCDGLRWGAVTAEGPDNTDYLRLAGELDCGGQTHPVALSFHPVESGGVRFQWAVDGPVEFSYLEFVRHEAEVFSGFGAQPRGLRAETGRLELQLAPGEAESREPTATVAAGAWPAAMTSSGRALLAQGSGALVLDLQRAGTVRLESWGSRAGALSLRAEAAPKTLSTWLNGLQGGPVGLPSWAYAAAVVGTARQGRALNELQASLRSQGTPVSRVLLEESGQPLAWVDWPVQRTNMVAVPLPGPLPLSGEPWPGIVTAPAFTTGWGPQSGLQGSLSALVSAGVSGISIVHTPVGGTHEAQRLWWHNGRTSELFLRWLELNTFTAWLRLHEGADPEAHYQMHDTASGRVHFDRMARLYAALADYREGLWKDAVEQGWPVVRPLWFEYPDDPQVGSGIADNQFMLGSHVLVAPVLESGIIRRDVYLPAGDWTHLWTGRRWSTDGEMLNLTSPIGEPIVLVRDDMPGRDRLLNQARQLGIGNLLSQ